MPAFFSVKRPGLIVSLDLAHACRCLLLDDALDTRGVRAGACISITLVVASTHDLLRRGPGTLLVHFVLAEFPGSPGILPE